jgi:hypothetical protein
MSGPVRDRVVVEVSVDTLSWIHVSAIRIAANEIG